MVWTADQVIKLVGEIGGIVGATSIMVQALHNNKAIAINSSNNAHQTLMSVTNTAKPLDPAPGSSDTKLTIETKENK